MQPVFVDRTGRRRRLTVLAGVGIGAGLLVSLALLVAGLFTGSAVPVPGWPEGAGQHGRDEAGVEQLISSPTAGPGGTATAGAPPGSPTATRRPTPSPTPRQPVADQPGQGDVHRNTLAGKPSESPGKPSRSPGKPG